MKVSRLFYHSHPRTIVSIIIFFVSISLGFGQISHESDTVKTNLTFLETDTAGLQGPNATVLSFSNNKEELNESSSGEISNRLANVPSFWTAYVFKPMRLGIKYETAYKIINPTEFKKNRVSFRLEYSKFLFDHFTLQFDTKLSTFLKNDHRTRKTSIWIDDQDKDANVSFGTRTKEAYLQASFHKTSIKAGIQTLAWGESDFAQITDEISPMDYREPLNLNLDELKIGQPMITVDQYTPFGDLNGFFIPDPKFDEYPQKGTGYYYDPFDGSMEYQMEKQRENFSEYGIRWRKTFGSSDVSIMAASLINNGYDSQMIAPNLIAQSKMRYSMAGITFNHAINNFLIKGEAAIKLPKAYNDASFQIVKKNNLDASLGIDYNVSSTLTFSMEAVDYHILDWNNTIQGVAQDNYMVLFIASKQLLNNDLSLNWASFYNGPYTGFFNLLTTSYNWNDRITLYFDALIPVSSNNKSGFYIYRNEKQLAFKIQYQF